MNLLRDETAFEELEVELQKKIGKGIGLCVTEFKNGKGVYISDLSPGGSALESEKLAVGDQIMSICGQDAHELSADDTAILMKILCPLLLKIVRYKTKQMRNIALLRIFPGLGQRIVRCHLFHVNGKQEGRILMSTPCLN